MTINTEQLKIAVCGHIDHGKSTLIGRLLLDTSSLPDEKTNELKKIAKEFGEETQLAYLSDQLKEERERNITIETTQIFLKTHKRPYCLIDTPGHLEFIKNMLTGASQADAALVLVDIEEGIADQTRRHAYLLKFLALPNIIVLVNKMDLVNYAEKKFRQIENELRSLFNELDLKPLHIIPISAKQGENIKKTSRRMSWFHGPHVINAIDNIPNTFEGTLKQSLRLPVQDVYQHDHEDIIVGRISSGALSKKQKVFIYPQATFTTIKTIKVFGKGKQSAHAGECIGLTLTDNFPIRRGDILCADEFTPQTQRNFRSNIIWLSSTKLQQGQTLQIQCATQTFHCKVIQILEAIDPKDLNISKDNVLSITKNQAALIEFTMLSSAIVEKHTDIPELGRYTIEDNDGLLGAGTILAVRQN